MELEGRQECQLRGMSALVHVVYVAKRLPLLGYRDGVALPPRILSSHFSFLFMHYFFSIVLFSLIMSIYLEWARFTQSQCS